MFEFLQSKSFLPNLNKKIRNVIKYDIKKLGITNDINYKIIKSFISFILEISIQQNFEVFK